MTYRINNIEVPPENPYKHDLLERQPLVRFLSDLIARLDESFVMTLDSPFGTGKTTMVRMLMEELKCKGHRCTYFNAWEVDYATDPLVALVSSIDRVDLGSKEANDKNRKNLQKVKEIATALAKPSMIAVVKALTSGSVNLDEIIRAISSIPTTDVKANIVEEFNQECKLLDDFKNKLKEAVEQLLTANKKTNLVVFVDELDRCRPTFAIHLLERIKHMFDIPNIVFVLSIDKKQIEASTKAVYGAEIDATEYLRRFFDLEYGIPTVNTQDYINSLITRCNLTQKFEQRNNNSMTGQDRTHFVNFFTEIAEAMNLSLRACERCITRLRIVMDQTPTSQHLHPVLVALLIVLHSNKPDFYSRIISGNASPDDVIEELISISEGKIQQSDNNIKVIHAYLLIADPDRERAQQRNHQLVLDAKSDNNLYATSLMNLKQSIMDTDHQFDISLADIAKKIDLVSWIRE